MKDFIFGFGYYYYHSSSSSSSSRVVRRPGRGVCRRRMMSTELFVCFILFLKEIITPLLSTQDQQGREGNRASKGSEVVSEQGAR